MSMTVDQLDAFLGRVFPTPLGTIATARRDGSPQITPVWFRWSSRRVTIWTKDSRVWVRNLMRDPRVAFAVHEDAPPFAAALIRGHATVETGQSSDIDREIHAITARYMEPNEIEAYIDAWPQLRSIVTIWPDRITSWGSADPDTIDGK